VRRAPARRGADHLATPAAACAAWLTGQSSARHSRLSPGQDALLDALTQAGYATVRGGFPYTGASVRLPYRAEPIVAASARNAAQFAAARLSWAFADDVAGALQPLMDRTERRLLLLCGSCGAEMLSAALPRLRRRPGLRVLTLALGPVGRLPGPASGVEVYVVRGRRDRLSRWASRRPTDAEVPGGHLDYSSRPEVRAEVARVARDFAA
jgi:hypothetical protein